MEWVTVAASIATALGFFLLVWQLRLAKNTLEAQTRAISLQTYISLTLEFLETMSLFHEHINDPEIKEGDLSSEERRALDRYFYFSNMEYILTQQNAVDKRVADQWLRGIKSSAKRRAIVERWRSTASKFTFDEGFKEFYEQAIREAQTSKNASE